MTSLVMIFTLVFAAVIQAVIPSWAYLGEAKLPLLLGVVMYYALTRERGVMLRAAFLAGIFQDTLSMIPLGYSSFCFCLVGTFINNYRENLFVHQLSTHVLFGAAVNLAVTILLYLLLGVGGHIGFMPAWFGLKCMGAVVLGGLVVPLVFRATEELEKRIGSIQARDL